MKRLLKISDDLAMPLDAVSQTFVFYGGKGMGKTNLLAVFAEELAKANLRWSVLDPVGVSWGLQYGADKSKKGLEVLVLGGIHGDIPIEPTAGKVVADLVADESVSTVIDISRHANGRMWTKAEKIRFVADYCTHLYERQGEKRVPIMQIIDEAGRFCPQQIPHGSPDLARCVGAIEEMVELGRNVGIGVTLVTQRSARMNKSVSELADCMVAFRTVGPNSVAAILDWLGEHIERTRFKEIVEKLRSLPRGQALFVSPGWLNFEGVVRVHARTTFDSSKTPEIGDAKVSHGNAAKPDLAKYRQRMAATIEKAQSNDTGALRRRVAELEAKLKTATTQNTKTPMVVKSMPAPKPILKEGHVKRLEVIACNFDKMTSKTQAAILELSKVIASAVKTGPIVVDDIRNPAQRTFNVVKPAQNGNGIPVAIVDDGTRLAPARQRILDSLAFFNSFGVKEVDRDQLALMADQSPRSGGYANNLGALRTSNLIAYPSSGKVSLTPVGFSKANHQDAHKTTADLQDAVKAKLPPARRRILDTLLKAYPEAVSKDELAQATGQSATSGGYANNLGAMRSMGLLDYPQSGHVRASDILFLADT